MHNSISFQVKGLFNMNKEQFCKVSYLYQSFMNHHLCITDTTFNDYKNLFESFFQLIGAVTVYVVVYIQFFEMFSSK